MGVAGFGNDRVLVCAFYDNLGGQDAGAVYVFGLNGILIDTIANPTAGSSTSFGRTAAAVGNDRIVVGSPFNGGSGSAYLFTTNGVLVNAFPRPATAHAFGESVAALGSDRVLIGSTSDSFGPLAAGVVYLFRTNGALITMLTNPVPTFRAGFGQSISVLSNNRLLIGAPSDASGVPYSGAAYLMDTNGALIAAFKSPVPSYQEGFGAAVAAAGPDRIFIGAPFGGFNDDLPGMVYAYSPESPFNPGLIAERVRDASVTTASLADGAVTAAKISGVLFPSQIPPLDAAKIASGTLADTRLSTNVALRTGGNRFSGPQILQNGRLGLGTTSPGQLLQVGDISVPNSEGMMRFGSRSGTGGAYRAWDVGVPETDENLNTVGYSFVIDDLLNGSTPEFIIKYDTGNVGINQTNPVNKLDVVGGTSGNAIQAVGKSGGSAVYGENLTGGGYGIAGRTSGSGLAVYGDNVNPAGWAGYFNGNVRITGTLNPPSDRHVKRDFADIDSRAVLEKVAALSIQTWAYTNDARGSRHLGPVAQEFKAAFGLGAEDTSITTVDADGVALAAIQGLNRKLTEELERRDAENRQLKARLERLEELLERRRHDEGPTSPR
jgi:hypothetical protein